MPNTLRLLSYRAALLMVSALANALFAADVVHLSSDHLDLTYDPDAACTGKVASIAQATGAEFAVLPPQNATGNWVKVVQRIPVRLEIVGCNNRLPLRAGMSANIEIDTGYQRPLPSLVTSALAWIGAGQ